MRIRYAPGALVGPTGVVASDVLWAPSYFARLRGVLGRPPLSEDQALVLTPCQRVHTRGVRYPLDVLFCSLDLEIIDAQTLPPGGISRRVRDAAGCIELVGGRIATCGLEVGEKLFFGRDR